MRLPHRVTGEATPHPRLLPRNSLRRLLRAAQPRSADGMVAARNPSRACPLVQRGREHVSSSSICELERKNLVQLRAQFHQFDEFGFLQKEFELHSQLHCDFKLVKVEVDGFDQYWFVET